MNTSALILIVLGVSLLLGGWVSNYASTDPDGLESVVQQAGIVSHDEPSTPLNSSLLAGAGGTLLVFGLGLLLGRIIQKRKHAS